MRSEFFRSGRALSLYCFAIVTAAGAFAHAQATQQAPSASAAVDLPSAKSLVDRHIAASGGREAMLARSSSRVAGTISVPSNGMSGTIEIFAAKPNKTMAKSTLNGIGEILEGFDGTVAWMISPMTGPMLSSPKELEQKKFDADFFSDLHYEKKYKAMKTVEKTTFEGKPVYKVALTKPDGTDDIEFFDVETGLKAGRQMTRETAMGSMTMTAAILEYRKFGVFTAPVKIKQTTMGVDMILTLEAAEFDKVDPSVFELPAAIKALVK